MPDALTWLMIPATVMRVMAPSALTRKFALYAVWIAQPATFALLTWWLPGVGIAVHVFLLVAATFVGLLSARLVIGDDGVYVRWFKQEKYMPYAALAHVKRDERGVTLCLADGEEVRLWAKLYGGHQTEIVLSQLAERMARWRLWPAVDVPALPPRTGGAYREPEWTLRDRVEAAVNPRGAASVRVKAATTLREEAAEAVLARLAESAEATANPAVRDALTAASGEACGKGGGPRGATGG